MKKKEIRFLHVSKIQSGTHRIMRHTCSNHLDYYFYESVHSMTSIHGYGNLPKLPLSMFCDFFCYFPQNILYVSPFFSLFHTFKTNHYFSLVMI